MRNLVIRFGLWLLRVAGVPEPPYEPAMVESARRQAAVWESAVRGPDQGHSRRRKVLMNLRSEFPDAPGRVLAFALERAMWRDG